MNIYSVSDFLTYTTYKNQNVVDVFTKISIPSNTSDLQAYEEYIIKDYDRWDRISQKFYGTPHLWWLIASYNRILDPFPALIPGDKINIIKPELIPNLLLTMKGLLK